MAAKKMTVRDAYAKAKKSEGAKGGTLYKGSKGIQRARAESKSQNPSVRNKVGVKSKDRPGPWDNIGRGLKTGAKIGAAVVKEVSKPARDPLGAAMDTIKGIRKDVKDRNLKGLAFQAATAVPIGRIGKGLKAADKAVDAAQGAATVAGSVSKAAKKAATIKKATKKATKKAAAPKATKKAAEKTTRVPDKTTPRDAANDAVAAARKSSKGKAAGVTPPSVSDELKKANEHLANVRQAMRDFNRPKANGRQISSEWKAMLDKEKQAQARVNNVIYKEQRAGKAAENMKKIGKEEPTRVDLSEGQTITKNKGINAPAKPRSYSKVGRTPKDRSGNAPLEKNQNYTYEADEMRRIEGKERFERREARRFEKSAKNKERQAKVDERTKIQRNQAKYDDIKKKAATGGPKAKERLKRYEDWAKEAGVWGSLKK